MEETKNNEVVEPIKKKGNTSKIVWSIIGITILVFGLCLFLFARQFFGNEVGDAVLGAEVPNGFVAIGNFFVNNAARLIFTLIIIGAFSFITFLLNVLINLIFRKTSRAKTIGSLLKSLIKYLFIVLAICFVLGVWNVNVYGIFAGVGVLALVIGLGCKSLVNDIVSGFFIVVDNYFQVGDKVIIDGFTGFIQTIGLRTTKLKSWDGNLKSINNSLITSVVNLSRYGSKVVVKINISLNEDLKRVEAVILKNLGSFNEKIPELTSPVAYGGVDALDDHGVCLIFIADVNESNRVGTSRKVLRELYLMLKENNVIIPFKQVVVNEPDPKNRPIANLEELKITDNHFYTKNTNDNTKKKTKFKDTLVSTIKETSNVNNED